MGNRGPLRSEASDGMQTGSRSPEKAIKESYQMSADNPFMDVDVSRYGQQFNTGSHNVVNVCVRVRVCVFVCV